MKRTPMFLIIDLFCGAGGVSQGFMQAILNGQSVASVIACVNHNQYAIKSHRLNHPGTKHFREDIRRIDVRKIKETLDYWKEQYPDAYVVLWASLECTNFSWAKGAKPRDADSRTLANHLFRYIEYLKPHYIMIENVVEFKAWGPLDSNGRPVSRHNGQYWLEWRQKICEQFKYVDNWTELNSANFGSYTSRNRLFGLFAKPGLPLTFPAATHTRQPDSNNLFDTLHQWKPVREVLDFTRTGQSIFQRKKPLSDKTLARIYKGLCKYVGHAGTNRLTQFISLYYTNGANYSVNEPLPTITTKDRAALITLQWKEEPATGFLYNPAWGGHVSSLDVPAGVIVARQDKAPLYLVQTHLGKTAQPTAMESPITTRIREFMQAHGIADISLRMLTVTELLRIQGFTDTYRLVGTLTNQKKFIGNAVVPLVVKAMTEALAEALMHHSMQSAA